MATRDTYEVQTWEDAPIETSPLSAARFNHMEQGIKESSDNRALKEIYDDESINLGRKAETEIGYKSTAEGDDTTASGICSRSDGTGTTSSGYASYAGGIGTTSSGLGSHSEGGGTTASGAYSHSEGTGTIASGNYQHVSGKFNEADTSNKFAKIIGGGTSNTERKNIHTLDWNGNAMYAGTVESQGLILTDTVTEQKYTLTIVNGSIEIIAIE